MNHPKYQIVYTLNDHFKYVIMEYCLSSDNNGVMGRRYCSFETFDQALRVLSQMTPNDGPVLLAQSGRINNHF